MNQPAYFIGVSNSALEIDFGINSDRCA